MKSCEQGIECTIFKRSRAISKSVCQIGKINQFCAENPQISGAILQNLVARVIWPPGFVRRCGIEPSNSVKVRGIFDWVRSCLKVPQEGFCCTHSFGYLGNRSVRP